MEKKTFLALALSMAVLIAWPLVFGKKNIKQQNTTTSTQSIAEVKQTNGKNGGAVAQDAAGLNYVDTGKTYFIENNSLKVGVSTHGAVINQIVFKDYQDDKKEFVRFFGKDVEKKGALHIVGFDDKTFNVVAGSDPTNIKLSDGRGNEVVYTLDKNAYVVSLSIKRASDKDPLSLSLYSKTTESKDANYGLSSDPDSRTKEVMLYSTVDDKTNKTDISKIKDKGVIYFSNSFKWVALSDRYFMMSVLDKKSAISDVSTKCSQEGFCSIDFSFKGAGPVYDTSIFVGPKDVALMRVLDPSLTEAINYGWFSFISVPMLELMKFFYSAIPNYGVAILILTLLVRLIMFPLQHKAMKSMKRMQDLQPHLKSLQEKYKNDKEKLNKEMMQFMKTHKMNPMSGCLPMLVQLPVFIALYKVLANSVELYRSPFIFWITDLSVKDHFYILPLLMGAMMFVQQKMTPNPTMDPTQAKIMLYMMPIIFTLMMLSLPSGLTLYIMFSTLLGIIQQVATNRILDAKK